MKKLIAITIGGLGLALAVPQTAYAAAANRPADHRNYPTYTIAQVGEHKVATDCWTAVKKKVFNLTEWLKTPEGVASAASITLICGVDSTMFFKPKSVSSSHDDDSDDYGYGRGNDDDDSDDDSRGGRQHRSGTSAKGASYDDDDDDHHGYSNNPAKALYKSIKPFKIGRLGLVASPMAPAAPTTTTPPATTPPPVVTPPATTGITMATVALHKTATDCWTAINGNVYNLSTFQHAGSQATITGVCGKDGSSTFTGKHGTGASQLSQLASLKVGALA